MAALSSSAGRVCPSLMQVLERRRLLAAVVINGSSSNDIVEVAVAGSELVALLNGVVAARAAVTAVDSIVVEVGGGEDTVRIAESITIPATINTGSGRDTVFGGAGDDVLTTGSERDIVYGRGGDDVISTGSEDDTVYGGPGNDRISTSSERDTVFGDGGKVGNADEADAGNDVIDTGSGDDTVYGGGGNDRISAGSETDLVYGDYETVAPDYPVMRDGDDSLDSGGGSDVVIGDSAGAPPGFYHGNDFLLAGGGDPDYLYGDTGTAQTAGRDGSDTFDQSTSGSSVFRGQGGNDVYRFFHRLPMEILGTVLVDEADSATGAGGRDTFDFSRLRVPAGETVGVTLDLASPEPQRVVTFGGFGNRLYLFLHNPRSIEDVVGSDLPDRVTGNDLANRLSGRGGGDTLSGGAGNDVLHGGAGSDVLRGDAGNDLLLALDWRRDTLFGGEGIDTSRARRFERDFFDVIPDGDIENR